jgi:hypothetical protein
MTRFGLVAVAVLGIVPIWGVARAADSPGESAAPSMLAPTLGALAALGTLAAGGALFGDDRPERQATAAYVMAGGMAIAPWLAHAGASPSRRAVAFGAAALLASVGTILTARFNNPFGTGSGNRERVPFGVMFTTAFFASTAGVIDGFVAAAAEP